MDTTDHSSASDQPNSLYHVEPLQMYSVPQSNANLPFKLLAGEGAIHHGSSVDGLIVVTNYRLYLQVGEGHHHVPLGLIEVVELRDLFYLHIGCKDARTYRCTFENNEKCLEWFDHISKAGNTPQLDQMFAFYYFMWCRHERKLAQQHDLVLMQPKRDWRQYSFDHRLFKDEMERLQFGGDSWRISDANKNYNLCPTYPPYLIVPSCITDESLESVAKFRSSRRIPAVVWRHVRNGAVIARCSQPEVGWLGWRSAEDEALVKAISEACSFYQKDIDKESVASSVHGGSPGSITSDDSLQITGDVVRKEKKVLIIDARSYTTAVANRARGGGCECSEYYPNCDVQFMNLANIHSIRKNFQNLRTLCMSSADQPNWFSQLEGTKWLQCISMLMKASMTLVNAIERDARPVLVHCSDGWDRTPQIVALAELLLDPHYRTMEGFRILVEREWLAFGHKFADRCGHTTGSGDQNERCPVFLQWLDCVYQVQRQFSCAFEFSQVYLVKLAQHIYANLYGTFLCNTFQERMNSVNGKTFSVWEFLSSNRFRNHLYAPPDNSCGNKVLWPQCNVRDLQLWNEVYLGTWEVNATENGSSGSCPGPPDGTCPGSSPQHMTKTRSYGDLLNAADLCPGQLRRSSDPSINIENKKLLELTSENQPQESTTTTTNVIITNGHLSTADNQLQEQQQQQQQEDFLCNALLDTGESECNNDCMYNKNKQVVAVAATEGRQTPEVFCNSSDIIYENKINGNHDDASESSPVLLAEAQGEDFRRNHNNSNSSKDLLIFDSSSNFFQHNKVIRDDKTDEVEEDDDDDDVDENITKSLNSLHFHETQVNNSHNNHLQLHQDLTPSDLDSDDNDCVTNATNASSVNASIERSIETSTDTLVSENQNNISSSPIEVNGFEKLSSPVETDGYKEMFDVNKNSGASNGKTSYSSSNGGGWENNVIHTHHHHSLGDDGLIPIRSMAQERLWQIIQEHRRKEELLERELHSYRKALLQQGCHRCCHNDNDKVDETGSVVESVCSQGEGQASAVESLRSDISWEAVDDSSMLEITGTLWVPDHAVSRCTGCQTEFWVGKRKHHCRKCGRIFCASCSENSTPLPSEQLYNPVRVCTGCYSKLRRDCGEIPALLAAASEQCSKRSQKGHPQQHHHHHHHHHHPPPTNANTQITASSN